MTCVKLICFVLLSITSLLFFIESIRHDLDGTTLSYYGMFILAYFLLQMVMMGINRRKMNSIACERYPPTTLLIVGYREDPEYWRKALEHSMTQDYQGALDIVVSIDGNEEEDRYMKDIAHEVLQEYGGIVLWNAHGGKRAAMAHGFRYILKGIPECEAIVVTDSDTRFEPSAVKHLVETLVADDATGCVTGSLRVFDTHLLGRIINARYAYAFDVERSAMSATGVMNCCSGPLSAYRASIIGEEGFIEEFLAQKCCGMETGPGDDRHLTLMTMARGFKSRQTHLARASTEAPAGLQRFLRQQARWMRSFYRELPYQIRAIPHQNLMLAVITQYEILYPFFILVWVLWSLAFMPPSLERGLRSTGISLAIAFIRTTILFIVGGYDPWLFMNIFYLPIYFFLLSPLKMYALATSWKMKWYTGDRNHPITSWVDEEMLGIFLTLIAWNGFLGYSFVTKIQQLLQ